MKLYRRHEILHRGWKVLFRKPDMLYLSFGSCTVDRGRRCTGMPYTGQLAEGTRGSLSRLCSRQLHSSEQLFARRNAFESINLERRTNSPLNTVISLFWEEGGEAWWAGGWSQRFFTSFWYSLIWIFDVFLCYDLLSSYLNYYSALLTTNPTITEEIIDCCNIY